MKVDRPIPMLSDPFIWYELVRRLAKREPPQLKIRRNYHPPEMNWAKEMAQASPEMIRQQQARGYNAGIGVLNGLGRTINGIGAFGAFRFPPYCDE